MNTGITGVRHLLVCASLLFFCNNVTAISLDFGLLSNNSHSSCSTTDQSQCIASSLDEFFYVDPYNIDNPRFGDRQVDDSYRFVLQERSTVALSIDVLRLNTGSTGNRVPFDGWAIRQSGANAFSQNGDYIGVSTQAYRLNDFDSEEIFVNQRRFGEQEIGFGRRITQSGTIELGAVYNGRSYEEILDILRQESPLFLALDSVTLEGSYAEFVLDAGSYEILTTKVLGCTGGPCPRQQERYADYQVTLSTAAVPIPATGWLFVTALICLVGKK